MQFALVTPWKISSGPAKAWADELVTRIGKTARVSIIAPHKSLESEKLIEQFLVKECEKIAQERGFLCFLDERGQTLTSEKFAAELLTARDRGIRQMAFVFGGAYGLPSGLAPLVQAGRLMSLSQATFAHELSLVVLLEQIYRAETIRANHPYHHGGRSPLVAALQSSSAKPLGL